MIQMYIENYLSGTLPQGFHSFILHVLLKIEHIVTV